MRGVVYVAYGKWAIAEATESIKSLRRYSDLPVAVIGEEPIGGIEHVYAKQLDGGGRLAKLNMDSLSPFDETLYLDADTRVHESVSGGFRILAHGWDMAMTLSTRQGADMMGHLPVEDRRLTLEALGCADYLALQAGVMFWQKGEVTTKFFAAWRHEWGIFGGFDQGALLRALAVCPIRIWLLGRIWNAMPMEKDAIVEHLFGRARAR